MAQRIAAWETSRSLPAQSAPAQDPRSGFLQRAMSGFAPQGLMPPQQQQQVQAGAPRDQILQQLRMLRQR
jgi:hypothetical protein